MPDELVTEIVAEWEPGTFVENLAPASDGGWLVTIPSHRRIDRVDRDGRTEVFAELDRMPTGVVADGAGALVLAGSIGSRDWRLVRVERGHCQVVRELPDLVFGNGMQRAGGHLLAMDSALGLALDIDPVTGESAVWLRHPLLLAPDSGGFMPGANGVAVHGESVYISNTARALLLRCSHGGHDVAVVAENLPADDFAVHPDGRIFLATHHGNSVLQLDPDGRRVEFAGFTGSTAVALDPGDSDVLCVTTTGGMRGPHDRNAQPARLIRLRPASDGAA